MIQFRRKRGFTLIEIMVVMAVISVLIASTIKLIHGTESFSRRSATDAIAGMIEQARSMAISTRSHIVIAIAKPGEVSIDDGRLRIGLFKVAEWSAEMTSSHELDAEFLGRWQVLDASVVLMNGEVEGLPNPMDHTALNLRYIAGGVAYNHAIQALVITPRGTLKLPAGSSPAVLRIAEGRYHQGTVVMPPRAGIDGIPETRLRIGRVIARSYRLDS